MGQLIKLHTGREPLHRPPGAPSASGRMLKCVYCEESWHPADRDRDAVYGQEWMCPSCEAWNPVDRSVLNPLGVLLRSIVHFFLS